MNPVLELQLVIEIIKLKKENKEMSEKTDLLTQNITALTAKITNLETSVGQITEIQGKLDAANGEILQLQARVMEDENAIDAANTAAQAILQGA
jgi:uncharacterized coiled-coil DUF342 family protein